MTNCKCKECSGTGSADPDCWLCKGQKYITVKKAYRHRYTKAELPEIDNGECDCPACEDSGYCMFCEGDGVVDQFVQDQQEMRVIIFAFTDRFPPCFYRDSAGTHIYSDIDLLSRESTHQCRENGLINWLCSIFGDEIYLTPKGKQAIKTFWKQYRALCREWIATQRKIQKIQVPA